MRPELALTFYSLSLNGRSKRLYELSMGTQTKSSGIICDVLPDVHPKFKEVYTFFPFKQITPPLPLL
jgi:hypothetical protein